jgi:predicted DNA binding CopG/RHH family protein
MIEYLVKVLTQKGVNVFNKQDLKDFSEEVNVASEGRGKTKNLKNVQLRIPESYTESSGAVEGEEGEGESEHLYYFS